MMEELSNISKVVAVIPSLSPDEKLPRVVKGLSDVGFCRIVVVDDGSASEYAARFEECTEYPGVTLLRHEVNRGKGAAMKTAFSYILENMPDSSGAITVDGDAQHHPEDCLNCAMAMLADDKVVLGVRDFSGKDVPKRSKMGNKITSGAFRLFCGMKLSDTQTGLRAFPIDILPKMIETKGDRYEYETQMLLDFKTYGIPFEEVKIRTVYLEENQTSHFRVFRDSARIYKMILAHFLKYSFVSVTSFFLEEFLLWLALKILFDVTGKPEGDLYVNGGAFLIARFLSSIYNVTLNYKVVFEAKCSFWRSAARYYTVCIPLAAIGLTLSLLSVAGVTSGDFLSGFFEKYVLVLISPIVQTTLFFLTYGIQREWVYKTDKDHQLKREDRKNGENEKE